MISIPNLPFEIIEHINHYLSHGDRYQLVQVNQIWHQAFILLLYRTITIESHQQFQQLVHIFQQPQKPLPLGKYVHQLNILLDQLEEKELHTIQKTCPFVQSIHVDWRIWNYLAQEVEETGQRNYQMRQSLPKFATDFLTVYGRCKLSSLTLDLYTINQQQIEGGKKILCYTPNLRNLTLMGINQHFNISIDFVDSIHQSCPFLENISLEGYKADAYDGLITTTATAQQQLKRMKSFKLSCQYGADRYQDWLPWFTKRYPNLISFDFNHTGNGKDIIEPCPIEVYTQFIKDCPRLANVRWNNSAPDFRFFQQLDKSKNIRLRQLEIYDNIAVPSLLTSALFDSCIIINVTRLTFGPVPSGVVPHTLIQSIAKACPQLLHLTLKEPNCNLTNPFKIDSILDHCRKLISLQLVRIALRVSFDSNRKVTPTKETHPLKSLTMRHCSSFDGVFDHISPRCPDLDQLSLFAYTQRDRRYKVQIHLPYQKFKKIQLHGLRTETYDVERIIRFFSVATQQQAVWYFMKQFKEAEASNNIGDRRLEDNGASKMEIAQELTTLSRSEILLLHSFLEKPMPWSEVEKRKLGFLNSSSTSTTVLDWHPKDIYDAGYVDLICQSVDHLVINKKLII